MICVAAGDPFFRPSGSNGDPSVDCAIVVSGVFDMAELAEGEYRDHVSTVMGAAPEEDPELYRKCSPVSYLRRNLPPQLVVYAGDEFLRDEAEDWCHRLQRAGAPFEVYMEPDRGHAWVTWHWQEAAHRTYDRMIRFLDAELSGLRN
jgi:acetyl esterase/lipase